MSLAFLDYLKCKEIKQAFIKGKVAFVLSFDGRNILWLNGAAACFFGLSSVADAIKQQSFFDEELRRQILKNAQYTRSITLRGLKRCAEFSIASIDITGLGKAFLLEALLEENVSLITGLDDATISAAIIDQHATVLEASSHFNFVDETIKILLQTIDDDLPVKTVLPIAGVNTQVGVIRLGVKPTSFLVLYAQLNEDELDRGQGSFSFKPHLLPRRFIWKMDADGYFCEVSKELAETVGPISSRIIGSDCHKLADQFNDEGYRSLSSFIEAAIPWREQKVQWPVDDCLERVDVELSAVPVFDTNRQLKGYHGFGVLKAQEKIQNKSDKKPGIKTSGLSEIERSAFHEIAERLRGELHLSLGHENTAKETPVQLPCAQTLPVDVIKQALIKEPEVILSLLDTVTDGVLWLDGQGCVQFASDAALALIGYEMDELLAQQLSSLFTFQSRDLIEEYFKLIRMKGKNQVFNHGETADLMTKNHENIKVSITIVPLALQDNYVVMLRDMTEMTLSPLDKISEENKMIEVVHEMRTPLNALIGFAEIMKDGRFGLIENERYRRYLRDIVSSGKHILSLVNQLLEHSKANYSSLNSTIDAPLMTQKFDVTACLRSSIAFLETQANHNGIIMRIVSPARVPFIGISQQIFQQIIWNLLSNAIRFTPSGGQIVIHVSYGKKERVKISISDNGLGMSDEEVVRAMQPYGQVERKDGQCGDNIFVGTGLGLPICKTMVEEVGGQFLLFSKPNHGTTVEMFFPMLRE
ncbi:PAS domain-containing sensor histidine kinase [Bartonella schoenbuchensis]|uniref:histidine kinase n=1 Tax=Bartonella schoenbuchensis (strain DSM 13525 / NCTC 13165 / R1) TaxID=687861 RepID=E6YZ27_BARSR|nr:PAS domain-containing sensor histidine kinase [Bartonella schoenbuchensis]AQX30219.1 PAS domain S-box-containing protein [Bartonella schoenbuchensis R1]CBI81767.1 Sensor protein (modular protein) [Bartonella schoenbuchensis R1]